jgi:hypothetical protein
MNNQISYTNNENNTNKLHILLALIVSITIDFIGCCSYLFPGIGESFDTMWAPISAFLLHYMYGSWAVTALAFVEEISPGLDFIPTAIIAWYFTYIWNRKNN